jgi:hypothetical protein
MKTRIAGNFSELVFNLDEVGSSEWKDRKSPCFIPYHAGIVISSFWPAFLLFVTL